MQTSYEFHPLCLLLPEPSATEYADLKADILQNGLIEPIILLDDQILDGRSRYNCCTEIGILPKYIQFADTGLKCPPTSFVISKNLKRRHLSTEQRGIAAGKLTTLESGALTKEEAAKLLNVSQSTVTRARKVAQNAIPEVQKEVESGMLSIAQAERIAKKSTEEQADALAAEKTQIKAAREKAKETKIAQAASQQATSNSEKTIQTYTDCDNLCREGQYDGKKLRKAISQLQTAVDDLTHVDIVLAEILEAGHAYHNLTISIDVLGKHPGIAVESLKKTQLAKQNQYDAAYRRFSVMKKFIDEFPALAESLFTNCSTSGEQDLLLEIQNQFTEHKAAFENSANHCVNSVKLQILTVVEAPPPTEWFSTPETST